MFIKLLNWAYIFIKKSLKLLLNLLRTTYDLPFNNTLENFVYCALDIICSTSSFINKYLLKYIYML